MGECSWDHRFFYIDGKVFYPKVRKTFEDNANTILISLDGTNQSDLNWTSQKRYAQEVVERGFKILWEIDLGLSDPDFSLLDELFFQSIGLAISHFVKDIFTMFHKQSIGVILYKGKCPHFSFEKHLFEEWLENTPKNQRATFEKSYMEKLFRSDLLIEIMQKIAYKIPDELPIFLLLDVGDIENPSYQYHFLSYERFEYFLLAAKGTKIPISSMRWEEGTGSLGEIDCKIRKKKKSKENVGVCFVTSTKANAAIFNTYNQLFQILHDKNIAYRILAEKFATEQWDELDYLIVVPDALTSQKERILQGFCAAGGVVVSYRKTLGLFNEISWEDFLKNYEKKIFWK